MRTFVPDSGWDTPIVLVGRRAASQVIPSNATRDATRDATRPDPAGEIGLMYRRTASCGAKFKPGAGLPPERLRLGSLDGAARVRLSRPGIASARQGHPESASPRVDRHRLQGTNSTHPVPRSVDVDPAREVPNRSGLSNSPLDNGAQDARGSRPRRRPSAGRIAGGFLVRAATLDEVARAAGVSRATASRVVNGSTSVGSAARESVERAVSELGYVSSRLGHGVAAATSGSIGVVIAEPTGRVFGDPFFSEILRGINAALSARHLQVALLMPQSAEEESRLEQYLAGGHVDGAIIVSLHGEDPLPERLLARGVPVVVAGEPPRGARVSYVDNDNYGGAVAAVTHLIQLGRKTVAAINGPLEMPGAASRRLGYLDALRGAGLTPRPELEAGGDFTREGGARAAFELLERCPEIDAIFAASDLMAAGALDTMCAAGRKVPAKVAIVGFDDSAVASLTTPALSSVRQSVEVMGRELVNVLLQAVDARDHVLRRVVLATELVVRESSGGEPTGKSE
jgi:DNA-binding LacI/PurR family transcriptional regulator